MLEHEKTRRWAGFFVETHESCATTYPAVVVGYGRRAREVMPAAMRALVRISASE
jgi:hypothetical protein